MKLLSMVGIFCFLGLFVVSRMVTTNASKKLSAEEKLRIFDAFSSCNNFYLMFVASLVFAYFGAMTYFPNLLIYITISYIVLFAIYLISKFLLNLQKLKEIEAPADYIKSFIFGYMIFIAGFAVLGGVSLFALLRF